MKKPSAKFDIKTTTVVHVRQLPPPASFYIGRQTPEFPGSTWANPTRITPDTTREKSILAYLMHLNASGLLYRVRELQGKTLACWCHPAACHGDILAQLANALHFNEAACPKCRKPVLSSPGLRQEETGLRIFEFWKCTNCTLYGFEARATLKLPTESEPEPTLL